MHDRARLPVTGTRRRIPMPIPIPESRIVLAHYYRYPRALRWPAATPPAAAVAAACAASRACAGCVPHIFQCCHSAAGQCCSLMAVKPGEGRRRPPPPSTRARVLKPHNTHSRSTGRTRMRTSASASSFTVRPIRPPPTNPKHTPPHSATVHRPPAPTVVARWPRLPDGRGAAAPEGPGRGALHGPSRGE